MHNITIAVVIPTYNASSFVDKALDSVAAQTHQPSEIIVVDDGSTDNTIGTLKAWQEKNKASLKILIKENGGTASARNLAISNATASHIALLDADDQFLPHHLETFYDIFSKVQGAVLAFSDAIREINGADDETGFLQGNELLNLPYNEFPQGFRVIDGSAYLGILQGSRIATCSCVFHRASSLEVGLFSANLRYSEDRDFFLRLSRLGQFAYVTDKLSIVKIHGSNKESLANRGNVRRGRVLMLAGLLRDHNELQLSEHEYTASATELSRSITQSYFWSARDGIKTYVRWGEEIKEIVGYSPAGSLKNLARAAWWSLRKGLPF